MRFMLFVLTLAVFAVKANAAENRQKKVDEAIGRAISVIDKALTRNSPLQETLLHMRSSFADVRWLPWGQDFPHCKAKPNVRAFVTRNSGIIRLCGNLFTDRQWNKDSLAQILLHEAAHVVGIHDECIATKLEVGALKLAKKSISFRSDYWQTCHITSKIDPFQIDVSTNP